MAKNNNVKLIEKLRIEVESDKKLACKLREANLYLTGYSKEFPGRVEKAYPTGRVELCPIGMTLIEARVIQREDSQKDGLSGIICSSVITKG